MIGQPGAGVFASAGAFNGLPENLLSRVRTDTENVPACTRMHPHAPATGNWNAHSNGA